MELNVLEAILRPFEHVSEPGASPGTVVSVPRQPQPVMRVLAYSESELVDKVVTEVSELQALIETYNVTWVNVDGLGDAKVIHEIGEMFGLHGLALEDVVNFHQRPKVEEYEHHLFIVARMVNSIEELKTEQITFFVGESFLITFQGGPPGDCLEPVRDRIHVASSRLRSRGTDYLTYALLDSIIDHYFPAVEACGEQLDELDEALTDTGGNASIACIHRIRSQLLVLRRAVRPHRELINELLRDYHQLFSEETRLFLRDCYDHTIQLNDAIDIYRETCSDLRDYHLAAVSNRTNDVMKTLTIVATIFIPLSFICGLYGMNFEYIPELNYRYGYFVSLGVMGGIVTGMLAWFWRKGWLGGSPRSG